MRSATAERRRVAVRAMQELTGRGWTLPQVAAAVSTSRSAVNHWKLGRSAPQAHRLEGLQALVRIAQPIVTLSERRTLARQHLRDIRSRGLNLRQIADSLGVPLLRVRYWSAGKYAPGTPQQWRSLERLHRRIGRTHRVVPPRQYRGMALVVVSIAQRLHLSHRQLSAKFQLPASACSNWINGYQRPNTRHTRMLLALLVELRMDPALRAICIERLEQIPQERHDARESFWWFSRRRYRRPARPGLRRLLARINFGIDTSAGL